MVDQKTSTIHIMGGWGRYGPRLSSTETLTYFNKTWEISSGSNLPVTLVWSAASASKSNDIIGYIIGGSDGHDIIPRIWTLQRKDKQWVEIKRRLQTARWIHSIVNVRSNEIPGC